MQIAAPIFLFALFPWAGVVLWLLLGRRRRVDVPFLDLWKGPVKGPQPRRRIGAPPIALVCALLAILLGILAAARPGIRRDSVGEEIVVVVDRGITMSMGEPARFSELLYKVKARIGRRPSRVVYVPEGQEVRTALDTRAMLELAVKQQTGQRLVVITDQKVDVDERGVVVRPEGSLENISIAKVAAKISPLGQVMVGVRNCSAQTRVGIGVMSDEKETARQEVELGKRGEVRNYFLPIEGGAKVIRVKLEGKDDFAGDDSAFLVRRGAWPRIEARVPVFAQLERLIEKYGKLRSASSDSKIVGIGDEIIIGKPVTGVSGKPSVIAHPITKSLEKMDWSAMAGDGVAELPEGTGWEVLVRVGEKAVLAVKNAPVRQVWVGVNTQKIAATPEFVILWSNIFDWIGEGGEEFISRTTGDLGSEWKPIEELPAGLKPGWWPGIYRRGDGAMLAVNAPDVVPEITDAPDWKSKLVEMLSKPRGSEGLTRLTTPFILVAMGLLVVAAITWRGGLKRNSTARATHHGQDARVTV